MNHPQTRALYYYWTGLKQGRIAPCRTDIEPRQIKRLLPNLFFLEHFDDDHFVFRLAGTNLCDRYGREFRAHNFLSLWRGEDRLQMRDLLINVLGRGMPGYITCRAETLDRITVDAEILVLPLTTENGKMTRLLGCAYATSDTTELGRRKLVCQHILHARLLANPGMEMASAPPPRPTHLGRPYLRLVISRPQP